jgi:hypothetical protein
MPQTFVDSSSRLLLILAGCLFTCSVVMLVGFSVAGLLALAPIVVLSPIVGFLMSTFMLALVLTVHVTIDETQNKVTILSK